MDDRREEGGVVTGTGTTSVPEVEAVKDVIEGATPVAAAVPEIVASLLTTALSADETVLAVAEDVVPLADDTKVLFAGTETRVPGAEVVKASLVAIVLGISLSVEVAETSLAVSDRLADVV